MTATAIPPDLQDELTALTETGLYASEEAVLADALRTLLAARPELRVAVARRLYAKGRSSLGKAAEWSGVTIENLKEELHERGIERRTEDDPAAIEVMAKRGAGLAGRTEPGW